MRMHVYACVVAGRFSDVRLFVDLQVFFFLVARPHKRASVRPSVLQVYVDSIAINLSPAVSLFPPLSLGLCDCVCGVGCHRAAQ